MPRAARKKNTIIRTGSNAPSWYEPVSIEFSFLNPSTIKYSRNKNPIENINPVIDNLNWSLRFLYKNKQISASKPSAIITIDNIKLLAKLKGNIVPPGKFPSNNTSLEVANAVMATIINQRV